MIKRLDQLEEKIMHAEAWLDLHPDSKLTYNGLIDDVNNAVKAEFDMLLRYPLIDDPRASQNPVAQSLAKAFELIKRTRRAIAAFDTAFGPGINTEKENKS